MKRGDEKRKRRIIMEGKGREGGKSDRGRGMMGGKDYVRASVKERELEMDREWEAENERRKTISKTDRHSTHLRLLHVHVK